MPTIRTLIGRAAAITLLVAGSSGATAAQLTGKENLVCATIKVLACTDTGGCIQGDAQSFELPTFMFIDLKKGEVRSPEEDGKSVASKIRARDVTEKAIILQGFENHRGWTIGIDREDASLALSTTGADVAFLIKGNCTPL